MKEQEQNNKGILYIEARNLVLAALEADILHWTDEKKTHVAVYHGAGDESHPEGWYAEPLEAVIQNVKVNEEAQELIQQKLDELNERKAEIEDIEMQGEYPGGWE